MRPGGIGPSCAPELADVFCRTQFCLPEFDNNRPPGPLGNDSGTVGGREPALAPALHCQSQDYITNLRSLYVVTPSTVPGNPTPEIAVEKYLGRPTLPPGLQASDWVRLASSVTNQVYFVTLSPSDRSRTLGVMSVALDSDSWFVSHLSACGEYLYPGSLLINERAAGVVHGG